MLLIADLLMQDLLGLESAIGITLVISFLMGEKMASFSSSELSFTELSSESESQNFRDLVLLFFFLMIYGLEGFYLGAPLSRFAGSTSLLGSVLILITWQRMILSEFEIRSWGSNFCLSLSLGSNPGLFNSNLCWPLLSSFSTSDLRYSLLYSFELTTTCIL